MSSKQKRRARRRPTQPLSPTASRPSRETLRPRSWALADRRLAGPAEGRPVRCSPALASSTHRPRRALGAAAPHLRAPTQRTREGALGEARLRPSVQTLAGEAVVGAAKAPMRPQNSSPSAKRSSSRGTMRSDSTLLFCASIWSWGSPPTLTMISSFSTVLISLIGRSGRCVSRRR